MNKPLISVLIAAYNVGKYLEAALRAVMAQSYRNLEIIVVNDGSPDNTAEILTRLAAEDARIRVLHNPHNLGIVSSLNKGLEIIQGHSVARIDSDDLTRSDLIKSIYQAMEQCLEALAMSTYMTPMHEAEISRFGRTIQADQILTKTVGHKAVQRHMLLHVSPCP